LLSIASDVGDEAEGAMKRLSLGVTGIAGVLLIGSACTRAPEAAPAALPAGTVQAGSTVIDCGPGQRVLLRQDNGLTRVQCVAATATASPVAGSDFLQPIPVYANVPEAAAYGTGAQAARPALYEPRPAPRVVRMRAGGRTWKKSAAIIGGSTAVGAGVGALLDGRGGAKKGAVAGLVGGVVYDIATRGR
jgi:NADPH:quinone reductase-like Zn-dependent oxidoreductase